MSFKPENSQKDWVVVGSGPSAPTWLPRVLEQYPDVLIACVNGSHGVLPKGRLPHTYAVFEGAAVGQYGATMDAMKQAGVRTFARRIVTKLGHKPEIEIDVGWGSEHGYDKERTTERLGGAMVSGGVELLHAVAHKFRPRRIHVVGFDGYEPNRLHADSAGDCPARDAKWCDTANASMSEHIAGITQAYSTVKFLFYGPSIHKRGWVGEFVQ